MQQNINPCLYQNPIPQMPCANPNAVNINIIQPQAYGSSNENSCAQNYYPLYQANQNPNLPLYPMNYNNMIQYPNNQQQGLNQGMNLNPYTTKPDAMNNQYIQPDNLKQQYQQPNQGEMDSALIPQAPQGLSGNNTNAHNTTNLINKTSNDVEKENTETNKTESEKKDKKEKPITILTDEYIKTLENYLNDSNPKVRLIAAKDVLERFKEDNSRIDNPSLTALLNKILRDTSPSVRFLGLTTLQLGYSIGNKETIDILKDIQATNKDKLGEDSLLASEILLKLSAPKVSEVK